MSTQVVFLFLLRAIGMYSASYCAVGPHCCPIGILLVLGTCTLRLNKITNSLRGKGSDVNGRAWILPLRAQITSMLCMLRSTHLHAGAHFANAVFSCKTVPESMPSSMQPPLIHLPATFPDLMRPVVAHVSKSFSTRAKNSLAAARPGQQCASPLLPNMRLLGSAGGREEGEGGDDQADTPARCKSQNALASIPSMSVC
jgi:hypothetical protein